MTVPTLYCQSYLPWKFQVAGTVVKLVKYLHISLTKCGIFVCCELFTGWDGWLLRHNDGTVSYWEMCVVYLQVFAVSTQGCVWRGVRFCPFMIQFNDIFPSTPRSFKHFVLDFPSRTLYAFFLSHKTCIYFSSPYTVHVSSRSHYFSFGHRNSFCWVQFADVFITQFFSFLLSLYFFASLILHLVKEKLQ